MSADLQTQVRELATRVDASQDPVTVDDVRLLIEGREGTEPLLMPSSPVGRMVRARGPWPAVVAAVIVILLFGALAWMLPSEEQAPADSFPPGSEGESGYYMTSTVPDGFVLQDMRTISGSRLVYLREVDGVWLPTDGGFAIEGVFGRPEGFPADPDDYVEQILETVPRYTAVQIGGRPGVLFETRLNQAEVTAPLIWVLGIDEQGGVFEISAAGMTREEVLAVAEGVESVAVEEFLDLGRQVPWDVAVASRHNAFAYSPPQRVRDLSDSVDVVLGIDLLRSRLARQQATVITTEDGEVVVPDGRSIRSTEGVLFLDMSQDRIDEALTVYPSAQLSPEQRDVRIDSYVQQVRGGQLLSEEPYVIQAPIGPEPAFDTSQLGEELPLVPATSLSVVPDSLFTGPSGDRAAATEDRPVIIIGTAQQPNSDASPLTIVVWFTEEGVPCSSTTTGTGMGSGCGFEMQSRFGVELFGVQGVSAEGSSAGLSFVVSYVVPMETSVVQVVTRSQNYWQRPNGGYGLVDFGLTVDRPTSIIAYDADGNEIGEWRVPSG